MYVFLVILASANKFWLVRLEPKPNRNNQEPKYLVPEISRKLEPISSYFLGISLESNFFKSPRNQKPNAHPELSHGKNW